MRKLFRTAAAVATLPALSMAAGAAEVGARPTAYEFAPVYVAPPFSWTGFYIGGNVGGAWDKRNLTDSLRPESQRAKRQGRIHGRRPTWL